MSNYFKEVAEANETSETEKKKTSTAFEMMESVKPVK